MLSITIQSFQNVNILSTPLFSAFLDTDYLSAPVTHPVPGFVQAYPLENKLVAPGKFMRQEIQVILQSDSKEGAL